MPSARRLRVVEERVPAARHRVRADYERGVAADEVVSRRAHLTRAFVEKLFYEIVATAVTVGDIHLVGARVDSARHRGVEVGHEPLEPMRVAPLNLVD